MEWPPSTTAAYIEAGEPRLGAGGSAGGRPGLPPPPVVVQPASAAEATETDAAASSERREIEVLVRAAVTSAPSEAWGWCSGTVGRRKGLPEWQLRPDRVAKLSRSLFATWITNGKRRGEPVLLPRGNSRALMRRPTGPPATAG